MCVYMHSITPIHLPTCSHTPTRTHTHAPAHSVPVGGNTWDACLQQLLMRPAWVALALAVGMSFADVQLPSMVCVSVCVCVCVVVIVVHISWLNVYHGSTYIIVVHICVPVYVYMYICVYAYLSLHTSHLNNIHRTQAATVALQLAGLHVCLAPVAVGLLWQPPPLAAFQVLC